MRCVYVCVENSGPSGPPCGVCVCVCVCVCEVCV